MKILIATDAYFPQVNGVVRTLHETGNVLKEQGDVVDRQYITIDENDKLDFLFNSERQVLDYYNDPKRSNNYHK